MIKNTWTVHTWRIDKKYLDGSLTAKLGRFTTDFQPRRFCACLGPARGSVPGPVWSGFANHSFFHPQDSNARPWSIFILKYFMSLSNLKEIIMIFLQTTIFYIGTIYRSTVHSLQYIYWRRFKWEEQLILITINQY